MKRDVVSKDGDQFIVRDENGNLKYRGGWQDDKPEGYGIYYKDGKKQYEGEWKNGCYHVKGSTWFNYLNEREEVIIPLKKSKSMSKKNNMVSDEDNKDRKKCIRITVVSIVSLLVLLLLAFLCYYLYICNRTDVTIHNSFEWNHVNKNVRRLVINEGLLNDLTNALEFSNYLNLESLVVSANCFQSVISLTISNNLKLSSVAFRGISFANAASITLSSTLR